jgi:NADH:ubiquinone oxidoreductase subunit E
MGFGPQIFVDGFVMGSVTSENVMEMLESYRAERSAEMRGNLKRK